MSQIAFENLYFIHNLYLFIPAPSRLGPVSHKISNHANNGLIHSYHNNYVALVYFWIAIKRALLHVRMRCLMSSAIKPCVTSCHVKFRGRILFKKRCYRFCNAFVLFLINVNLDKKRWLNVMEADMVENNLSEQRNIICVETSLPMAWRGSRLTFHSILKYSV